MQSRRMLTSGRTTTALVARISRSIGRRWFIATILRVAIAITAEATSIAQRDVVGACDALTAPRHDE